MKKNFAVFPILVWGMAALPLAHAQAPTKVAVIEIQAAIVQTKEGQKALQDLQAKFNPKKQELDKKQADLMALQDQLKKGAATMSDAAKEKIQTELTNGQKDLTRRGEDFDAEVQQDEGKVFNELGAKLMDVVIKYATQNGFAMVLNNDPQNQQNPVLWHDTAVDISAEMVKQYDLAHPVGGAAPAAPAPAATKPAAPPANKPAAPPAPSQKKQ